MRKTSSKLTSVASLLFLLALIMQRPSAIAQQQRPSPVAMLSWIFRTRHSKTGDPKTDVMLLVGNRSYVVLHNAVEQFKILSHSEYLEKGVPAKALTACSGWWAGSGDDLYVVRHGTQLNVYRREVDEDAATSDYKLFKSITMAPLSMLQEHAANSQPRILCHNGPLGFPTSPYLPKACPTNKITFVLSFFVGVSSPIIPNRNFGQSPRQITEVLSKVFLDTLSC